MRLEYTMDDFSSDIEDSIDGLFIIDLKSNRPIYVNKVFTKILNISKEKILGVDFLNFIFIEDRKKYLNYITKLDKINVREKYFSIRLLKGFNIPIEVELVGTLIKHNGKKSAFYGILRDISITKRLEKAFTRHDINFKEIIETINDAIVILNLNGKFQYVSPRFSMILGSKEIFHDFYSLIHPKDVDMVRNELQNSLKQEEIIYLNTLEFRIICETGGYKWFEASTRKYFHGSNKIQGFLIVIRDIDERKRLEEILKLYNLQIKKKNEELEELDRIKTELMSNISHELRTPLISIKGFTELLIQGKSGFVNEQQIHDLNIITKNTDRIVRLVDDLLDVSKIEENQLALNKEYFDFRNLIRECVKELKCQIQNRNHNIRLHLPNNKLQIRADKNRIHQLIINLLDNSIKYTPLHGMIDIHLADMDEKTHFYIKDSGIGLTNDEISRIFIRFGKIYMPDHIDIIDSNGTGLGLAICKGIIKEHGGKIWVRSEGRNKGAEFHFTIPKN